MTNAQMYFAIAVPVFAIIMSACMQIIVIVWQAKGIEKQLHTRMDGLEKRFDDRFTAVDKRLDGLDKRLDRLESRLTVVEQDYKVFFQDISRIKSKVGL